MPPMFKRGPCRTAPSALLLGQLAQGALWTDRIRTRGIAPGIGAAGAVAFVERRWGGGAGGGRRRMLTRGQAQHLGA